MSKTFDALKPETIKKLDGRVRMYVSMRDDEGLTCPIGMLIRLRDAGDPSQEHLSQLEAAGAIITSFMGHIVAIQAQPEDFDKIFSLPFVLYAEGNPLHVTSD